MKRISFFVLALSLLGCLVSCEEMLSTIEKQQNSQVKTLDAVQGIYGCVTLSGQVSGLERAALDFECGIEYSVDEDFNKYSVSRIRADKDYSEDTYNVYVSSIQSGIKYYYRAYYINQQFDYYGEVKSFSFVWNAPEVVTLNAEISESDIISIEGIINGLKEQLNENAGYFTGSYGIQISLNESFDGDSVRELFPEKMTGDTIVCYLSSFKYGERYYYRTFFRVGDIVAYGEIKDCLFEWNAPEVAALNAVIDEYGRVTMTGLIRNLPLLKDGNHLYGFGIEYSLTDDFSGTVSSTDSVTVLLDKNGDYSDTIVCITPRIEYGVQYYFRIYCMCDGYYCYSNVNSFRFEWEPRYVDLGLSVKWATCNLGGKNPDDYGKGFRWGDVNSSGEYIYSYLDSWYDNLTKYCNKPEHGYNGFTDDLTTLEPNDDAAHVLWGGNWRIPTPAEMEELLSNCSWNLVGYDGVNGYLVTSNIPGYTDRSIFLPAAGGGNLGIGGSEGLYWSNSLCTDDPNYAQILIFSQMNYTVPLGMYRELRTNKMSIRAVCP